MGQLSHQTNRELSAFHPAGNTTTYTYDTDGKLITMTDPIGLDTTFAYDVNGMLATVSRPTVR